MRTVTINLHQPGGLLNGNGNLVRPCRGDLYKVCGQVAESWESNADFTQWTFKVRDGIKWHDGTLFTAEDAKFWLELVAFGAKSADGAKTRAPAYFAASFGPISKVETLPGNRLRITLSRGDPQYLFSISLAHYTIAHPRHLMKPRIDAGDVGVAPQDIGWVSLGAFKMLKYEKGSRIQLRRSELYWEKDDKGRQLPYLDGADYAVFSDPSAVDAAFRVGRIDAGTRGFGFTLTKERKEGVDRDMAGQVWYYQTEATRGGPGFNVIKPGPLQDVRVRRAISLWLDKRAAIPSVLGGFGYLYTILSPNNPYTSPDFLTWPGYNEKTREQDRAEAKRLLAEAGYAKGAELTGHCRRLWISRCEFVHAQLAALGINLKLDLLDDAGWNRAALTLDYDMGPAGGLGGASSYSVVPEAAEEGVAPYDISKGANSKHLDKKLVQMFDQLRTTTDLNQRLKLWREIERYYMLEQAYEVSLYGDLSVIPFRNYVKGVIVPSENNQNDTDYATVWLDK
jgi:peptide/nickel transport system substrate-binding protein